MSAGDKYVSMYVYDADDEIVPIRKSAMASFAADEATLRERSEYKIALFNHDAKRRVDAAVYVDGKAVGTFRLEPNGRVVVERPTKDARKFVVVDSDRVSAVGFDRGNINLGRIKVVARRERLESRRVYRPVIREGGHPRVECDGPAATALGERSEQRFRETEAVEHDGDAPVVLEIKLCVVDRYRSNDLYLLRDCRD